MVNQSRISGAIKEGAISGLGLLEIVLGLEVMAESVRVVFYASFSLPIS